MDQRYARAVAALNTAAKLAKEDQVLAQEFMDKNPSYFPKNNNDSDDTEKVKNNNIPIFVPLNLKNK